MIIRNYKPVYGPETEAGTQDPPENQNQRPPMNETPVDGPGSGRSQLRQQLEKSFKEESSRRSQRDPAQVERETRRTRGPQDRLPERKGAKDQQAEREEADAEGEQQEQPETETEGQEQQDQQEQVAAPEAWPKEAKAEWANLPATVQAAIAKREVDGAKGVEQLKQSLKQFEPIAQVLQPRMESIRQFGHSPAEAVGQLFAWFDALGQDVERVKSGQPVVAFPLLAQSFGLDPKTLFGGAPAQPGTEKKAEEQPAGDIPAPVQQYITALEQKLGNMTKAIEQKFGALENTFATQREAQTQELIDAWAKDKPYFKDVKVMMGHLLASGQIPALPNGAADLDTAYEQAVYANRDTRARMLEDQRKKAEADTKAKAEKERRAQQDQVNGARKAAVGLGPSSPGTTTPGTAQQKGKKSVRESIMEAIDEVSA